MSFSISSSPPETQFTEAEWKSRASFGMEKDAADKLPPAAKAKLSAMRDQLAEARAIIAIPRDKLEKARDRLDQVETRLDQFRRSRMTDDHPLVRAELEVRDRIRAEHKAASEEYSRRSDLVGPLGNMLRGIEAYVASVPQGVALAPPTVPKLLKGEAAVTALDRVRERVQALNDAIQAAIDAPITSADAKKAMRSQVAALAERGKPDVTPAIDFAEQIKFAMTPASVFVAGPGGQARGNADVFDAAGMFAWLFQDALIKKLDAEIDEAADDGSALTDQERRARIAAAKKELLEVEREEEALIEAAKATGLTIQRRATADPRAVLGLADSAPAPKDD